MLTEQQLKQRKTGLGGSDIAAILGLSPWTTPLQVYMRKTGELPEQDESPAMRWGSLLEPKIIEAYEQETGNKVLQTTETYRHPEYDFMLANLDGIVNDKKILEVKTARTADGWGEAGTDDIPVYYTTQVQHYMAVLGADECDVAVLIGGSDFRVYTVQRNDDIIKTLIQKEREFWRRVINRQPPDIMDTFDWKLLYKNKLTDNTVETDIHTLNKSIRLKKLDTQAKEIEAEKDKLKGEILSYMKDNKDLLYNGFKLASIVNSSYSKFNESEFKENHPDLYDKYKTTQINSNYLSLAKSKKVWEAIK